MTSRQLSHDCHWFFPEQFLIWSLSATTIRLCMFCCCLLLSPYLGMCGLCTCYGIMLCLPLLTAFRHCHCFQTPCTVCLTRVSSFLECTDSSLTKMYKSDVWKITSVITAGRGVQWAGLSSDDHRQAPLFRTLITCL